MSIFKVDTKLFRELGELLVGRESTATVELIKNAYDADARKVRIFGEKLGDSEGGFIAIQDNGSGMSVATFERGFLTIAGRSRTDGERRSAIFGRRFTGEKGVGRLAAHKLAAHLTVVSRLWDGEPFTALEGLQSDQGVRATIDWNEIEKRETLDDIEGSGAVVIEKTIGRSPAGTVLSLRKIRKQWSPRDFDTFFNDVATLSPPPALVEPLTSGTVSQPLIFSAPVVRDTSSRDPGFEIEYAGEFLENSIDLPAVAESATWIIEVNSDVVRQSVTIAVEPTKSGRRIPKFKTAEGWQNTFNMPPGVEPVSFTARIFERESGAWPRAFQGVRVYLEGFRIPPYGDANDDWLDLDREYRSRGRGELGRLRRFSEWKPPEGDLEEGLVIKGNSSYFGAVFLTREGSSRLKMLVNREGFLPSPSLDYVRDVLRWAIGIQVRQRRMSSKDIVEHRKVDAKRRRTMAARAHEGIAPAVFHTQALHREALSAVHQIKALAASGNARAAATRLDELEQVIEEAAQITTEEASEAVMYRVLASVGLEQAAFVHEILGLGVTAQTISTALERLSKSATDATQKRRLKETLADANDLRERLRRNGVYLSEMTGIEGRKRRSRLNLRKRLDPVIAFHQVSADSRKVQIANEIPENLESPPVFPAEVAALFSNLLSNAIKFAGSPGRIVTTGRSTDEEIVVRMENTGIAVQPAEGERWFEPFRSTTSEVDASLGQGMGLGLTVSRSLMDEYGGEIVFVPPTRGFATAIEIRWPRR